MFLGLSSLAGDDGIPRTLTIQVEEEEEDLDRAFRVIDVTTYQDIEDAAESDPAGNC